jgi:hypothetical protein
MTIIARIISIIFHPLLLPTAGIVLILNTGGHLSYLPLEIKRIIFLIVAVSTCIIPLTLIPLFQIFGVIDTVYMSTRKERFWPILATSVSVFAGYWLLGKIPFIPGFILSFVFFALLSVIVALSVTLFWKISIHMVGMGGISALVTVLALKFNPHLASMAALTFVLAGIVGWARLFTESHKPAEVYAGFLTGFALVSLSIL